MQKILAIILCTIIMCGITHGVICGTDGDVVYVDISGEEYGFYGDGFADGESVIVLKIGNNIEEVWKNDEGAGTETVGAD